MLCSLFLLTGNRGPRPEGVQRAKELCEELLEKVKADYHAFKERPPQQRYGGGSDGQSNGRPGYGDRGDRDRSHSYGYGGGGGNTGGYNTPGSGYGGQIDQRSPSGATDPTADPNAAWAAYYAAQAANGTNAADPYAQYGGYEGYVAWWNYYNQTAQQSPAPGTAAAAPPPPPESAPPGAAPPPPPPPPPAGSPPGAYNAVSGI